MLRARRPCARSRRLNRVRCLPSSVCRPRKVTKLTRTVGGHLAWRLKAKEFRQSKDSLTVDLKEVKLQLYNKDDSAYDLVTSAAATLTTNDNRLYSDGDVEITLGEPANGEPKHTLVSIVSSGIAVDQDSGRAETDRPTTFTFQNGVGRSTGATYDPNTRELFMKQDAVLNLQPKSPKAKPTKIEAGSLNYFEAKSEVWLKPWGKLTRGDAVVEGQDCVIHFREVEQDDGTRDAILHDVDASHAHGTDVLLDAKLQPDRKLQYAGDRVHVDFDDDGVVSKITARTNAQVTSLSTTAETSLKADYTEMHFANASGESVLDRVDAQGHAVASSKPVAAPGRPAGETNILRADSLEIDMRFGGREIDRMMTHSTGSLEFVPNQPTQRHRTLDAFRIAIQYGARNEIETFRADDVKTRTEPTADEIKRNRTIATTSSKTLTARFDPKTGHVATIEQAGDFVYDEGDRHARAASAEQNEDQETVVLRNGARVWDPTGSTSAATIHLNQRTGDYSADGGVSSSRMPDQDRKKNPEMLSGDQPVQAQAARMSSSNRGRLARYEGGALMWQGANRIQADAIQLDKDKHTLVADGKVVTSLWDQPKDNAAPAAQSKNAAPATDGRKNAAGGSPPAAPILTVTRAAHMTYSDADRIADYTGGVTLERAGLRVKSSKLQAFLASGGDSRLEKAYADGSVEIVETTPGKAPRTGTGDHAEYYESEQKVILDGKPAHMVDGEGTSTGLELTYWTNDARLLITGTPKEPVQTRIMRDSKKTP